MQPIPRAAVIQDLSGVGRCSLTVALPVLSALGVQCCPLPTAVLSSHTAFPDNTFLDLTGEISPAMDQWAGLGLTFDGLYSGFLASVEQVDLVREFRRRFSPGLTLVDPAMADHGKPYRTCTPELCEGMGALAEEADVITPNLTEAAMLLGLSPEARPRSEGELSRWAARLSLEGRRSVVITGVRQGDNVGAYCWDRTDSSHGGVWAKEVPKQYPGTGDLFASVLLGWLLEGKSLREAAAWAVTFVSLCAAHTLELGSDVRFGVEFEPLLPVLRAEQPQES